MLNKRITAIILSAFITVLSSSHLYAKNLDDSAILGISTTDSQRNFTIKDLGSKLSLNTVVVNDPVYQKQKRYEGFWLSDILHLARVNTDENSLLSFIALDGYKASIAQKDIITSKARAFIAIRDIDATDNWEKFTDGKQTITPGPFYLVWQSAHTVVKLPWPYEIVKIVIANNDLDRRLFPDSKEQNPSIVNGYKIFKQNCLSCHSINLQGGAIGPELNIPRNILEYENPSFLKAFIANPNAFRARSKMPEFDRIIAKDDIDDVIKYLTWMGKHKIEGDYEQ